MRKKLINILFVMFAINSVCLAEYVPSYAIIKRSVDTASIEPGKSAFVFSFKPPFGQKLVSAVSVDVNGKNYQLIPDSTGKAELILPIGKHGIHTSSYYYEEIRMDTIFSRTQERIEIEVNFEIDNQPRPMKKPVIYVYAKQPTNVNIKLEVWGDLNFTYPAYNNGWNFIANADGTFEMGANKYNYLFWEGSDISFLGLQKNINTGYKVNTDTLVDFLESSLAKMGLNTKETQDFITFWYPQMQKNKLNFVHFIFNESCDKLAKLSITPKPDHVFRVSMVWSPIKTSNAIEYLEQIFPTIIREGLTVIEWGGVEIESK